MTTTRAPQVGYAAEMIVEDYLSGVRIDSFLVRRFRNYTAYRMQRMIRVGLVAIEGVTVGADHRVFAGERVTARLIEPPDKLLDPEPLQVDVLHEDEWIMVVNKPPDQVTHPVGDYQSGTLTNALQHHLDRQTPLPGLLRPGIVHRLDRQTSGAIVVSKEHLAHRVLSLEFQRSRVAKTYLALVEGRLPESQGSIDLPIGRTARGSSILMSARGDARNAKPARTLFEVVERLGDFTLVRAKPLTGRGHQIRVHFATVGHPVIGDEYYGRFGLIKRPKSVDGTACPISVIGRQALHAQRLAFAHPMTARWMEFYAPMPRDMQAVLRHAGARLSA